MQFTVMYLLQEALDSSIKPPSKQNLYLYSNINFYSALYEWHKVLELSLFNWFSEVGNNSRLKESVSLYMVYLK
jgi:hypothetical protein